MVLLHVKCLIQNYCQVHDWKNLCTFLSSDSHPLRGAQNIATGHKVFCKQYSEKERIESLYFPEGK